jgi:hypothetical protein
MPQKECATRVRVTLFLANHGAVAIAKVYFVRNVCGSRQDEKLEGPLVPIYLKTIRRADECHF